MQFRFSVAFGRKGYSIALMARSAEDLKGLEKELVDAGYEVNETPISYLIPDYPQAAAFPVPSYSASSIASAYQSILSRFPLSQYSLRVALYNAGDKIRKPFLQRTSISSKKLSLRDLSHSPNTSF